MEDRKTDRESYRRQRDMKNYNGEEEYEDGATHEEEQEMIFM
jgi:hypothetical protein